MSKNCTISIKIDNNTKIKLLEIPNKSKQEISEYLKLLLDDSIKNKTKHLKLDIE